MDLNNLNNNDLFGSNNFIDNTLNNSKIHLRSQQRNGKKSITIVQGLDEELDEKKILKYFKKTFQCNGCISEDKEYGKIIQLSGDQKDNVKQFLIQQQIYTEDCIVVHGY